MVELLYWTIIVHGSLIRLNWYVAITGKFLWKKIFISIQLNRGISIRLSIKGDFKRRLQSICLKQNEIYFRESIFWKKITHLFVQIKTRLINVIIY